jgi:hypothetical protein
MEPHLTKFTLPTDSWVMASEFTELKARKYAFAVQELVGILNKI